MEGFDGTGIYSGRTQKMLFDDDDDCNDIVEESDFEVSNKIPIVTPNMLSSKIN